MWRPRWPTPLGSPSSARGRRPDAIMDNKNNNEKHNNNKKKKKKNNNIINDNKKKKNNVEYNSNNSNNDNKYNSNNNSTISNNSSSIVLPLRTGKATVRREGPPGGVVKRVARQQGTDRSPGSDELRHGRFRATSDRRLAQSLELLDPVPRRRAGQGSTHRRRASRRLAARAPPARAAHHGPAALPPPRLRSRPRRRCSP